MFLHVILKRILTAGLLLSCLAAAAQEWPARPIRLLVGFTAGGAVDATARILGDALSRSLGQPVVVENRAGAGGLIAVQGVVQSKPDGYTLLVTPDAALFAPDFMDKAPFNTTRDLAPIAVLTSQPVVVAVHPSLGVKTVAEFVSLAKKKPGQLNFGTIAATAGTLEYAANTFLRAADLDLAPVPYKGGGPAVQDLVGGQIPVAVLGGAPLRGPAENGSLLLLAVTSGKRSPSMPGVPTLAESGYPDINVSQWIGALAPAGTPQPVVARLAAEFNKALADPAVRDRLARAVLDPMGGGPEEFAQLIRNERTYRQKVMKVQK